MSVNATYTVSGAASSSPSSPSSGPGDRGLVRLEFCAAMLRVSPPWLQRFVGGAIMKGLGTPIDTEVDRNAEGVETRFPLGRDGATIHPEALSLLGRERRILRGPGELDTTFAQRLRTFWDAHRTRGSAYALLGQLFEFFRATNNVPIQYIANSGTSVTVDAAGTFTRSVVGGWSGDGEYPTKWARFFLVFYLLDNNFSEPLEDENGNAITDGNGAPVLVQTSIYSLSTAQQEIICSVPREWSAAHIDRIYIVLIPGGGYAWGLPPGIAWGDVGKTWGGSSDAVTFQC